MFFEMTPADREFYRVAAEDRQGKSLEKDF
jgi:hypothetical protein